MNVLLSSVGRRSYLVRYFQEALAGRGKVIATNSIPNTPGMLAADEAVQVPPIADDTYTSTVLDICRRYNIRLVCSVFDLDLAALAPLKPKLEDMGVHTSISSPTVVDICFDKWKTVEFASRHGIDTPPNLFDGGICSQGARRRENPVPTDR